MARRIDVVQARAAGTLPTVFITPPGTAVGRGADTDQRFRQIDPASGR